MLKETISLVLISSILTYVSCSDDKCQESITCGSCIQNPNCEWCKSPDIRKSEKCRAKNYWTQNNCNGGTEFEKISKTNVEQLLEFGDAVQIKPQKILAAMRSEESIQIPFYFKSATDPKLDMYFVLDGSISMKEVATQLNNNIADIYKRLKEKSNSVQFGFGTFVDKNIAPFAGPHDNCYSFHHHLKLTDGTTEFSRRLKNVYNNLKSKNNDRPEGGFDALMQAMVCSEIGWRKDASRVIVYVTSESYHSAGDGRVALITRPHDMKCYLYEVNDNGYTYFKYNITKSLEFDYPSVSQIRKIANRENIKIFFYITAGDSDYATHIIRAYENLANHLSGTGAQLVPTGEDIASKLVDFYMKTADQMHLNIEQKSIDYIKVTLDPPCNTDPHHTDCKYKAKEVVNVTATLKMGKCPLAKDAGKEINIFRVTERKTSLLTITVDNLCQCECEKEKPLSINSTECSFHGDLQCGLCLCVEPWAGEKCDCNKNDYRSDPKRCKKNENSLVCSNRGKCRCGRCEKCSDGAWGEYCEYTAALCPNSCSNHGTCTHNKERNEFTCECHPDYVGKNCSCTVNKKSCVDPNDPVQGRHCRGMGECECGNCVCRNIKKENFIVQQDRYCRECINSCKELGDYVQCVFEKTVDKCLKPINHNNTEYNFDKVSKEQLYETQLLGTTHCEKYLGNGSYISYKYQCLGGMQKIVYQGDLNHVVEVNMWPILYGVVGGIVLIGVLTILAWKILTDHLDKKEYDKLVAMAKEAGIELSDNPLYQNPSMDFINPTFGNQDGIRQRN